MIINDIIKSPLSMVVTSAVPYGFAADDVSQSESAALYDFYAATAGDQWAESNGWFIEPCVLGWFGLSYAVTGATYQAVDALKDFYFATAGATWINKNRWLAPYAINRWQGVYGTS